MRIQKGFLFTIGIIFFASTLIFYTQFFFDANLVLERGVLTDSALLTALHLNEDVSFDLLEVLKTSFFVDSLNNSILIQGEINSNGVVSTRLNSFKSFLESNYFSRSIYSKSIDLTNLSNKAEFFIGEKIRFDYNYGNLVALINDNSGSITSIDLNIVSSASDCLTDFEWSKQTGTVNLSVNYVNDCNDITVTDSISGGDNSFLKLIHSNGETELIEFGKINYLGKDYTNSVLVESIPDNKLDYNLGVSFSDAWFYPIRTNAVLELDSDNFDSNIFLTIYK